MKMNKIKHIQWNQIRWILLGCVPLFFFLRGIHLILTGGGWIAITDQPTHWILLFLEIFISVFAIFGCIFLWYQELNTLNKEFLNKMMSIKIISISIIIIFIIHFIRVGFWIQNSVFFN
jgi:hypothetical protein